MRTVRKVSLLVVLFAIFLIISGCSAKQDNTSDRQTAPAQVTERNKQADSSSGSDSETQSDEKNSQENTDNRDKSLQPEDKPDKSSGTEPNDTAPTSTKQVNNSQTSSTGKPDKSQLPAKALVFTYNADCCESTKLFFEQHRDTVKEYEKKYGDRVKFTWYDVALRDEVYQKELNEVAKNVDIKNIPAFVVLNMNGKVLLRQTGQLKIDEVNKIFERLNI